MAFDTDDAFPDKPFTLKSLYREVKDMLASRGSIDSPDLEARRIIEQRTPFDIVTLVTSGEVAIAGDERERALQDARDRLSGKPLSRVYGKREFWGLPFELSSETLDPRPDTEILVERVLSAYSEKPPETILDVGTGSGCILISLLSELREAQGLGIDLSFDATQTARKNARQNQVESRSRFICGSWMESIDKKFDLIVSNPPYIANQIISTLSREVKNHDPILALDGGEDGLQAYLKIFSFLKPHLNRDGKAFFEIGFDQRFDVMRLAEDSGLHVCEVHADLSGQPRVVEICCGDK